MKRLNINTSGNKKLKNTENVRFMIWNLPAVKTCPFSTEHCRSNCYARKAERVYPQVLPSRENNYIDSLSADFVENMIFTIERELNSKKYRDKLCVFRIHESGDFYNLEYTRKWIDIIKHFENDNRIVFLAYTKSIVYFVNFGYGLSTFPQNFVVRSSLWDDTNIDFLTLTYLHKFPIYTALTRKQMNSRIENGAKFTECRCNDCATCGKCWNKEHGEIVCEIH